MNYILKNRYASLVFLLSVVLWAASCIKDDFSGGTGTGEEDITIKLGITTRAGEDGLIRDNDDRFGSLAVYAFDEGGNFLALYKYNLEEAANTYTTPAFNCGIKVRKLLGIANYAAYPDLDEKLVKGLSEDAVKALTANDGGTVALSAANLLMIGETTVAFAKSDDEDEEVTASLELKRLAARVDVFVFKETGCTAEVQLETVEFVNGVKNTALKWNTGQVELPAPLQYAAPQTGKSGGLLEPAPSGDYTYESYEKGCFYSYRTQQAIAADNAPKLNITVRVNGNITRTYSAVIANKDVSEAVLDAGNVYQVKAVLAKSGLVVSTNVVPWDAEDYVLDFKDDLLYKSEGWAFGSFVAMQGNTVQLYTDKPGILRFSLLSPNTVRWKASLTNNQDFKLGPVEGSYEEDAAGNAIVQKLEVSSIPEGNNDYASTELSVFAVIGGVSYEMDLTTDQEMGGSPGTINRFTITRGNR